MKKLIAMIGAVATAFGLYAGSATNITFQTSFEEADLEEGVLHGFSGIDDLALANTNQYASGEVYAYDDYNTRRPEFAGKKEQNNYLKLETGTNTLTRALDAGDVFADQLVKFTGFEEPQTNIAGKVAVWMTAIEQEGTATLIPAVEEVTDGESGEIITPAVPEHYEYSTDYIAADTNLYVTIGAETDDGFKQKAYKLAVNNVKPDQWYRVTIKTIGNIFTAAASAAEIAPRAGFAVYVDGQLAKLDTTVEGYAAPIVSEDYLTDDAKALFVDAALLPAITDGATLATVGYQGIGAIDDITLDNLGPEFARTIDFTFALEADAEVTAVVDSKGRTLTPTEAGVYTAQAGVTLTATVTAKPGFFFVDSNGNKTLTLTLSNITPAAQITLDLGDYECVEAAVMITPVEGDDRYYTAEEAIAALSTGTLPVDDGDIVTFLKDIAINDEGGNVVMSFSPNTTISVTGLENGSKWDVFVANYEYTDEESGETLVSTGYLEFNRPIVAQKQITVTFDNPIEIEGEDGPEYVYGNFVFGGAQIAGNLTVVGDDSVFTLNPTTLVGDGKVTAGYEMTADAFVNASEVEVIDNGDDTWTAQIKQAPQGGFMVIIAGQDPQYYETLAEAVEKAPAGATIQLLEEAEIPAFISITKDVTIDLNGFTLAREDDEAMLKSLFEISNEATLTVDGTVTGSAAYGRLASVGKQITPGTGSNGKLIVNGGTYTAGATQTAIHVNGDCSACEVTINDATIVSTGDNGVQFNGKGTFAINRSSITGATAIYMKAGTLTIDKDSVIAATAEAWTAPAANHNGSNPTGDAIVMDSITGYKGAISLTVADGATVTSVAGATIRETITDAEDSTTVKIDAPTIGGIALTEAFLAKVAGGSAQLPGYVAAIGTVPYQTLQAAITAAGAKATVKLIANAEENVSIAADKDITLDLNGKTLTGATATYAIVNSGVVTIKGGTVQNKVTNHNSLICNKPVGYMTIENGTFICDRITIKNDEDGKGVYGTLVINGGTFTASKETGTDLVWDAVQNWGDATINGGTFDGYIECRAESTWNAGVMEINGGTFNKPVQTVVVFDAQKAPAANAADVALTINGGTFNDMVMRVADVKAKAGEAANVRVDFDETMPEYVASCETLGTITIPGMVGDPAALNPALFANNESVFCEEGFETVKAEGADYYSVAQSVATPVAKIGEQGYPTLAAAVAAVDDGQTIQLLDDVALATEGLTFSKSCIFDLGGYTLTCPTESINAKQFVIGAGAEVVFTNGTVAAAGATGGRGIQIQGKLINWADWNWAAEGVPNTTGLFDLGLSGTMGEVVVNGGNIVSAGDIFRAKISAAPAKVTINGGTLTATGEYGMFYTQEGTSMQAAINGGVIEGKLSSLYLDQVTMTLNAEGSAKFSNVDNLDTFLPTGYEFVKGEDDYYTIQKIVPPVAKIGTTEFKTLQAAFDAAQAGETVELLDNLTVDTMSTMENKDLIFNLGGYTLLNDGADKVISITNSTVVITNGTINGVAGYAVENTGASHITIARDATIVSSSAYIVYPRGAVVDIYGTITQLDNQYSTCVWASTEGCVINIYDGANLSTPGGDIIRHRCNMPEPSDNAAVVNIYGGTFSGGDVIYGYASSGSVNNGKVNIYGGTFTVDRVYNVLASADLTIRPFDGECSTLKFSKLATGLADACAEGYAPVLVDGWYVIKQLHTVTLKNGDAVVDTQVVADGQFATNVVLAVDGFNGWTNETYTAAFDFEKTAITADVTLFAWIEAAGPVYPQDLPEEFPADADQAVKDKYVDWAKTYGVTDASGLSDAFLMNADPKGTIPTLKVESIAVEGDTATIVVSAEGVNLETGINGKLFVDGADELGAGWATTAIDATADSFTEGKATFTVPNAKFMKARVDFKVPEVETK